MWVGTSDIKFYLRGPGSMRSGIRFEMKIDQFREIKFAAVSGAPNISGLVLSDGWPQPGPWVDEVTKEPEPISY